LEATRAYPISGRGKAAWVAARVALEAVMATAPVLLRTALVRPMLENWSAGFGHRPLAWTARRVHLGRAAVAAAGKAERPLAAAVAVEQVRAVGPVALMAMVAGEA